MEFSIFSHKVYLKWNSPSYFQMNGAKYQTNARTHALCIKRFCSNYFLTTQKFRPISSFCIALHLFLPSIQRPRRLDSMCFDDMSERFARNIWWSNETKTELLLMIFKKSISFLRKVTIDSVFQRWKNSMTPFIEVQKFKAFDMTPRSSWIMDDIRTNTTINKRLKFHMSHTTSLVHVVN